MKKLYIGYKLRHIYYNIRNRLFKKYYLIDIKAMPRGDWWDTDYRMFHGMFQLLVDYVEGECSHLSKYGSKYVTEKLEKDEDVHRFIVAYYQSPKWFRWIEKERWNRLLGQAHLEWEISLDRPDLPENERNPSQAKSARKILELYKWYKDIYPNRIDPCDAFPEPVYKHLDNNGNPTDKMFEEKQQDGFYRMNNFSDEAHEYYNKVEKLEDQYYEEEQQKLKELIDIRNCLWT